MTIAYSDISIQVPYGHNRRDTLRQQGELIQTLSKLSQQIRAMKEPRAKKVKEREKLICMIIC